ncbi:MAG: hypothetical protein H8E72_07860 [Candidatus Marinimicrobia bacterium]|nr:hypothetical protein [Candidatus Neomarinimicrobiota bacterium]
MTKNRHKMLNIIKFLILSLSISLVVSQNLETFMQKTTLENSLRDKIYSEVGHVIDKTKFVVVVNLDLDNGNLATDLNSNQLQSSSDNQMSDLAAQAPSAGNSMDFIPGFQLSGSATNQEHESQSNSPATPSVSKGAFGNLGSLKIKKISVNFFLEESLASPTLDKTITTLVNGIIPMISNCDDCISIETMQFQKSSEKSELADLREKMETMERERREEELAKLDQKFDDLKDKLSRSEDQREMWEEQAILDREFQRRQDSLRLVKLEANEDAERLQLDTLLYKAQQKIDTVINARIESETETKKDLIDIIKYGQGNLSDDENQGILGMKGGSSSDSTLIYLGLGAIIFLMFMMLFFKKNKQEVVYLKPKGDAKKKTKKEKKKSKVDEKEEAEVTEAMPAEEKPVPEAPTNPYATMAFEDENVIRAELKALRQSAVSMSVNQREGATQIVKDWLSDGGIDSETEGEEG